MELIKPSCVINPSLDEMQSHVAAVIQNAIDVHYAVSSWGKQAKTAARKLRRVGVGMYDMQFYYILGFLMNILH